MNARIHQPAVKKRRRFGMHPREFGEYRIVKLLPLGGMGRVYLAIHARWIRPSYCKVPMLRECGGL